MRREAASETQVLGMILSQTNAMVRYCLAVVHRGSAGEAMLAEIGSVYVEADIPAEFGHTQLPREAGTDLDAKLIVTWTGGRIECRLAGAFYRSSIGGGGSRHHGSFHNRKA